MPEEIETVAPGEPVADATASVETPAADVSTNPSEVVTPEPVVETPAETPAEVPAVTEPATETPAVETPAPVIKEPEEVDFDDESDDALEAKIAADPKRTVAEIKALRKEAADSRVKAKDVITSLFGEDVDEEFVSQWSAIGKAFAEDPEGVRPIFAELAGIATPTAVAEKSPKEVIEGLFAAREAEHNRKAAEVKVGIEMAELGYKTDPEPGSKEQADLNLLRAFISSQPADAKDLKAADASAKAYKQAIFQEESAKAKAASAGIPPVASGTGSAASVPAQDASTKKEKEDPYDATVRLYAEKKSADAPTLNG